MPAAFFPPCAVSFPSPPMLMVLPEYTAMPGASGALVRLFVPSTDRSSVTPFANHIAALYCQLATLSIRFDIVSDVLHAMSMFALP